MSVTDTVLLQRLRPKRVSSPPRRYYRTGKKSQLNGSTKSQSVYQKRKAAGLCTQTGCKAKPAVGHTHCGKHLAKLSRENKARYNKRASERLCIYCGERPQFWGVRCIICRQNWASSPLPLGARQALRLYREAEAKREREQLEVNVRHAIRKLLASGEIKGQQSVAWRLYAGVDDGEWRTYKQVGKLMKVSKQWVSQLLHPAQVALAKTLKGKVPWKTRTEIETEQRPRSELRRRPTPKRSLAKSQVTRRRARNGARSAYEISLL